ncbi:MAG: protein kinase domain-containing protein [Solirubrobacterales bacterium]
MVGEVVMDRFRLLERIGSGGMGTVYRAFDERLQRQVAVKEITSSDPERVAREAQAAARLNHPGIVTLYELGSDGGRALLVSELVDGATLAELAQCGDLSDREVAEFGADVCEALAHAHERGVIHRDVKPQNVIVRVDDGAGRRAKLMDFGIASLVGAPTLTATGEVIGTLAYMAPEQATGAGASEASDVYSLALTLYECWSGANPVAGHTPAQTARQIGSPLPALGDYRPDLPAHMAECIDACLDPEPELRPTLDDLDHHLDAAIPRLDGSCAVPVRGDQEEPAPREQGTLLRVAQLAALCVWGVTVMLLAVAAGRPGLALVLGVLSAPAILVASWLPWAGIPLAAPLLGAASAGAAYPALAGSRGTLRERAVLGALGWCWMLCGAAAFGLGSTAGLVDDPPHDWMRTTGDAASGLLAPLASPEALLGAAIFAVASAALGLILRAGHIAVALLGAVLWAACLDAALRVVGEGDLGGVPVVAVAAAAISVILEFRRRGARPAMRRAPVPSTHPAMGGSGPSAGS